MVFDPISLLIQVAIAVLINVVAYVLMPKPKGPKPEAARDMDNPTADQGRPIPVVFGTVTVKGLNVLWFGDKRTRTYEVNA
jgi:predicted phage tail protein